MDVKLTDVLNAVGGKPLNEIGDNVLIGGVSTDTRTIAKEDIFFALKGPRFDGHDFIREAFEKGSRNFVVSETGKIKGEWKKASNFIVVNDVLKSYGDFAAFYRKKFRVPAVAITGSTGKTTVKELIAHLLSQRFRVLKNRGTENNLVGVPKAIFGLDAAHEVLVLEIGTNQPGEIDRLSSIIGPQIGVITQIGLAHLEGLGGLEGVKKEKVSLLNHIERGGVLVLNGQDPMLKDVKSGVHKIIRAGFSKDTCDETAERTWCHDTGSSFYLNDELFETQLIGRHNALNCVLAIQTALLLGMDGGTIKKGLSSFKPVGGRMNLKLMDGIYFIDDTYNSNPTSFKASLETLKEFKLRERKGVICGDMLELGERAEELHREAGALLAEFLFDFVITVGPLSKWSAQEAVKNGFNSKRIHHVKDSAEAGKLYREMAVPGDRVLVKGSRGMKMEKVFECFITCSTL